MRHYWDQPIQTRSVQVTECPVCEGGTIVLLTPVVDGGSIVGMAVTCAQCLVMLNQNHSVHVEDMSGTELYRATGCRVLPHWNRYNAKVFPKIANWLEMRWRKI